MYRKISVGLLALVMILSSASCGNKGQDLASSATGGLEIVSTNAFTDQYGTYRIVGEIRNNSAQVLTWIELGVEIEDSGGLSLLKDESGNTVLGLLFNIHLPTLGPGESSTFSYAYDTSGGTPSSYKVTIVAYQASQIDRAALRVENAQMVGDGNGSLYLSGELVNPNSEWVHITSLAGAAKDGQGKVLSAESTVTFATELAPAGDQAGLDRTPFAVYLPDPDPEARLSWQVYFDTHVVQEAPTVYPWEIKFTNHYIDQNQFFHLVGTLKNTASIPLETLVVAGLFAADGKVLDADFEFMPMVIEAGATIPFDISSFYGIKANSAEALKVDHFTVKVDPFYSVEPTSGYITLESLNDELVQSGSLIVLTGSVTNTSNKTLAGEKVIVSILDSQRNVVAANFTLINPPGESILPGETTSYETSINLDPNADTSGFSFRTIVQGDVKE